MIAAIALGSNLPSRWGTAAETLNEAVHRLAALGDVVAISRSYQTDPVGFREQPRFTNAAALIRTTLGPLELMRGLLAVEQGMGRVRAADTPPKGPRVIDLDLLLYEGEHGHSLILSDRDLTLPHPAMHERAFVLEPLHEIAPEMMHPVLNRSVAELWTALSRESKFL